MDSLNNIGLHDIDIIRAKLVLNEAIFKLHKNNNLTLELSDVSYDDSAQLINVTFYDVNYIANKKFKERIFLKDSFIKIRFTPQWFWKVEKPEVDDPRWLKLSDEDFLLILIASVLRLSWKEWKEKTLDYDD